MDPAATARAAPRSRLKRRFDAFARRYPKLYASRHVIAAASEVVLGALGVGALLALLLPNIDLAWFWSWLPQIDLSWLRESWRWLWSFWPDWLTLAWLWPDWLTLAWLWPDWLHLPGWLKETLGWVKWIAPVVIAAAVAAHEVKRGKKRRDDGK